MAFASFPIEQSPQHRPDAMSHFDNQQVFYVHRYCVRFRGKKEKISTTWDWIKLRSKPLDWRNLMSSLRLEEILCDCLRALAMRSSGHAVLHHDFLTNTRRREQKKRGTSLMFSTTFFSSRFNYETRRACFVGLQRFRPELRQKSSRDTFMGWW